VGEGVGAAGDEHDVLREGHRQLKTISEKTFTSLASLFSLLWLPFFHFFGFPFFRFRSIAFDWLSRARSNRRCEHCASTNGRLNLGVVRLDEALQSRSSKSRHMVFTLFARNRRHECLQRARPAASMLEAAAMVRVFKEEHQRMSMGSACPHVIMCAAFLLLSCLGLRKIRNI